MQETQTEDKKASVVLLYVPGVQFVGMAIPVIGQYVPAGHTRQTKPPGVGLYFPRKHKSGLVLPPPLTQTVPAGHTKQSDTFAPLMMLRNVPWGQEVGLTLATGQYLATRQSRQAVALVTSMYVPAVQLVGLIEPAGQ